MLSKYIISEGVEAEGCLPRAANYYLRDKYGVRFYVTNDYSVYVPNCPGIPNAEVHFHSDDANEFENFVKDLFNNGFYQNKTCSNHRHVRLVATAYRVFELPTAVSRFIDDYIEWAKSMPDPKKYIARVRNPFTYGVPQSWVKLRYTAINMYKMPELRTVEFRLFPYVGSANELLEQSKWLRREVDALVDEFKEIVIEDVITNAEYHESGVL